MAWVYLDDQMADHPKIVTAGDEAGWMFTCGLMYCRRYGTEGMIPVAQVPRLTGWRKPLEVAQRLVDVGLWHRGGHECGQCPDPGPDRFVVHDFPDWNRTQESRSNAGRKAANARWARKDALRNDDGTESTRVVDGRETADSTGAVETLHATPPEDLSPGQSAGTDAPRNASAMRTQCEPHATTPETHMPQDAQSLSLSPTYTSLSLGSTGEPPPVDDVIQAAAQIAAEHEADHHNDIRNRPRWTKSRAQNIRRDNETAWRTILETDPTTTAEQLANPTRNTPEDRTVAAQMRRITDTEQRLAADATTPAAPKPEALAAIAEARQQRHRARTGTDPPPAA